MAWTSVSFCMSTPMKQSAKYSKISQHAPMHMENATAETAIYSGVRWMLEFSLRFRMSNSAKPIPAHMNPQVVCKIVSQNGMLM